MRSYIVILLGILVWDLGCSLLKELMRFQDKSGLHRIGREIVLIGGIIRVRLSLSRVIRGFSLGI